MAVALYPIVLDSQGVAYLENTSTKVLEIVLAKQAHELTPEEAQEEFPDLTLAQVYAALAYYHAHKVEIDAQIQERRRFVNELQVRQPGPFTREALLARRNTLP